MPYQNILDEFVNFTRQIIGENLTGIYLHGSMAMGCFHPDKSDIDLIVIIEEDIADIQKMQFMERVVQLNKRAPAKGLELSIIRRKYCDPFMYPTPFELHFSPVHLQWFQDSPRDYIAEMKGTDIDLAAHFSIINQYGIVLYGEAVEKVFAKVPPKDYIDSICADVENAKAGITEDPLYSILNLCRTMAFLQDGLYLSKEEGGNWALKNMKLRDCALVVKALECYRTGRDMTVGQNAAESFAEEIWRKIVDLRTSKENGCTT